MAATEQIHADYSRYIAASRYARYLDDQDRRETWEETVDRYCSYMRDKFGDTFPYEQMKQAITKMDVVPSMRGLMTAGPALDRDNISIYNCSYVAVDHPRVFDEILYILMCGVGVGFSVERQFINNLPQVPEEFHESDTTIEVKDSRIGWASSYRELVSLLYSGRIPKWDVSKVRSSGARLKTFGGRASGPEPLVDLFKFTVSVFKRAAGRKLTSLECHDIVCKVADIVVVGGVRRSALISLSNLTDERMRGAKNGAWWEENVQRALANNSVAYTEKPEIGIFMEEWKSLYESRSGERGLFNRVSANTKAGQTGRREVDGHQFGTNPCLTADMRILTESGYLPIGQLVDKPTRIWNGFEWSDVIPFSTGVNPVYGVTLSDGTYLKVTPYHKFIMADGARVEAKDLLEGDRIGKFKLPSISGSDANTPTGDAYTQGFYSGDGNSGMNWSWVYEPKFMCLPRLQLSYVSKQHNGRVRGVHGDMLSKAYVPVNATTDYCLNWFAGLCDSDGTIVRNPNSIGIQISSIDPEFLGEVRVMLTRLGVKSKVTLAKVEQRRDMPGGSYLCQTLYRLLIGAADVAHLIEQGLKCNRLDLSVCKPNRDASRFVTVVSVEDLGYEEETFCLTDPKNNSLVVEGVITGNCGEIILRSGGLCNLTEAVVRADDNLDSLKHKVELATILGTFQAAISDFRYLRPVWKRNAEEERLLGVSLTGIMDHHVLSKTTDSVTWFKEMKEYAIKVNAEWAARIGINPAAAITTCKPSGTVSQLVNSSSGIHPRYSPYYVRTVRSDKKDPLAQFLIKQGVPFEPDVTKPDSVVVFSFPIKSPDIAVFRNDLTAVQQLEHYQVVADNWTEHNPSITVYVRENEWLEVGAWVYKHFDKLGGVSFLPHSDHVYKQAPYQEITKDEYEKLASNFPTIDWKAFSENGDNTKHQQTLSCVSGYCELV